MSLVNRVLKKIKDEGLLKSFKDTVTYTYDHYYDKKYKIDTFSWVEKEDLDVDEKINEHAVMYQATKVLPLRKLFKKIKIPKGKIITDLGSGKGRVLLVAAEFGFNEARGVEFSPVLCHIAEKNIAIFKEKTKTNTHFSIINIDASQYIFKDDEYVFFLYNPFDQIILKKVLHHISESLHRNKREILIIYAYPVNRKLIESEMQIKSVKNLRVWGGEFVVYEI